MYKRTVRCYLYRVRVLEHRRTCWNIGTKLVTTRIVVVSRRFHFLNCLKTRVDTGFGVLPMLLYAGLEPFCLRDAWCCCLFRIVPAAQCAGVVVWVPWCLAILILHMRKGLLRGFLNQKKPCLAAGSVELAIFYLAFFLGAGLVVGAGAHVSPQVSSSFAIVGCNTSICAHAS